MLRPVREGASVIIWTGLEKTGGDELAGVFEVFHGVEFDGEELRSIDDAEGVALWNKALESPLIEDVDEPLALYHQFQFLEKGCAVFGSHLLETDTFANGLFDGTGLAKFHDTVVTIDDNLNLFLSALMTVQC